LRICVALTHESDVRRMTEIPRIIASNTGICPRQSAPTCRTFHVHQSRRSRRPLPGRSFEALVPVCP
jgi:hypothetical protein